MKFLQVPGNNKLYVNKIGTVIKNNETGVFQVLTPTLVENRWCVEINQNMDDPDYVEIAKLLLEIFVGKMNLPIHYKFGKDMFSIDAVEYEISKDEVKVFEISGKNEIPTPKIIYRKAYDIKGNIFLPLCGYDKYIINKENTIFNLESGAFVYKFFKHNIPRVTLNRLCGHDTCKIETLCPVISWDKLDILTNKK